MKIGTTITAAFGIVLGFKIFYSNPIIGLIIAVASGVWGALKGIEENKEVREGE